MSQKIQVRRGTNAERQTQTFDQGEPVWTTDTKALWMGDGSTVGGVSVGSSSLDRENTTVVNVVDSTDATTNGTNLMTALSDAYTATPYNKPVNGENPFTVLLPPAKYKVNERISLTGEGINIVGMTSNNRDVEILMEPNDEFSTLYGMTVSKSNCSVRNVSLTLCNTGYSASTKIGVFLNSASTIKNILFQNIYMNNSGSVDSNLEMFANPPYSIGVKIKDSIFHTGGLYNQISTAKLSQGSKIEIENVLVECNEDKTTNAYGIFLVPWIDETVDPSRGFPLVVTNSSFIAHNNTVIGSKANSDVAAAQFNNCYFSGKLGVGQDIYEGMGFQYWYNWQLNNCHFQGGPAGANGSQIINGNYRSPMFNNCLFEGTGTCVMIKANASGIFNSCIFNSEDGGVSISGVDSTSTARVSNSYFATAPEGTNLTLVESNNYGP